MSENEGGVEVRMMVAATPAVVFVGGLYRGAALAGLDRTAAATAASTTAAAGPVIVTDLKVALLIAALRGVGLRVVALVVVGLLVALTGAGWALAAPHQRTG